MDKSVVETLIVTLYFAVWFWMVFRIISPIAKALKSFAALVFFVIWSAIYYEDEEDWYENTD